MRVGDMMASTGFENMQIQNPKLMKIYNAKKGTGGAKSSFGDVQYLNEIIRSKTFDRRKAYAVSGVRIQSFSDYVPRMVFDYVQVIADLAAKKMPAHAYTKEKLFAYQFGLTGAKINLSLVPDVVEGGVAPGLDAKGNYVWNKEVLITVGGSEGIDLMFRAMINPGDEVLIPQPSYVSYEPCAVLANATPVIINLKNENQFRLTPEELEAAITPRSKVLVLPFPNNPTGAIMEREDLEKLVDIIVRNDLYVLSDEIYGELTYTGKPHVSIASFPGMKERTVVVNGFSKAYAMTGWRLGYACGPEAIISQMTKIHQYAIMCAPTTSQYAAVEALRNGDEDVRMMRESYNERRRFVLHTLEEMGIPCFEPLGAFYVFPCIKEFGLLSEDFANLLLAEEKVAIVPGTAFGDSGEGFLRISYAYSIDNLRKALARLARFVEKLRARQK